MNYLNKKVAITGQDGFLGRELAVALEEAGARVHILYGDSRDPETFAELNHRFDYLFHFGSPSSQVLFKRQAEYAIDVTINGFRNALAACENYGIKLIYPSTGLLSAGESNEYARCKAICEDLVRGGNIDALGIRIFATYGPGEGHKRDYASVPYLFIKDVLAGRKPVIFGDGTQQRDFIYIDDVVSGVLTLAERCNEQVIDLGFGKSHSFNEIIYAIGDVLKLKIEPELVNKPAGYVDITAANVNKLKRYYTPKVTLRQGIERIIKHEESNSYDDNQQAHPGA